MGNLSKVVCLKDFDSSEKPVPVFPLFIKFNELHTGQK